MVPSPHYSLADFRDFRQVMLKEGVTPLGQIIYYSGVIFCAPRRPDVQAVFKSTLALAKKYRDQVWSDQTYLSLAIELQGFNPYTLSPSFNYRAFGELISGSIRIWHSYEPLRPNAGSLEKGYLHRYEKGKLVKAVKVPLCWRRRTVCGLFLTSAVAARHRLIFNARSVLARAWCEN